MLRESGSDKPGTPDDKVCPDKIETDRIAAN